jgi:hypothetical protein
MSVFGVEKALYDLSMSGKTRKAYVGDPDAFLAAYNISEAEARDIKAFQVANILALGVNPMLVMGFWLQLEPGHSIKQYLRAISAAPVAGEH